MAARNLLNGFEAAILDVLHADSDSDIDCFDDESEQETVINDNIHVENVTTAVNNRKMVNISSCDKQLDYFSSVHI
jgi:hypothetical protein